MVIDINLQSFFPDLKERERNLPKKCLLPKYNADDLAVRCQAKDYQFDKESLRTDCFREGEVKNKKKTH
mgnify:CR=1 FL=1